MNEDDRLIWDLTRVMVAKRVWELPTRPIKSFESCEVCFYRFRRSFGGWPSTIDLRVTPERSEILVNHLIPIGPVPVATETLHAPTIRQVIDQIERWLAK